MGNVMHQNLKRGIERRIREIEKEIASILMVHENSIHIERGQYLSAGSVGFHLRIHLDVNKGDRMDMDYQNTIQKVIDNGKLGTLFRKCWQIPSDPTILG